MMEEVLRFCSIKKGLYFCISHFKISVFLYVDAIAFIIFGQTTLTICATRQKVSIIRGTGM